MDGWMSDGYSGQHGWMAVWIGGCRDGWLDGWMQGWVDGMLQKYG